MNADFLGISNITARNQVEVGTTPVLLNTAGISQIVKVSNPLAAQIIYLKYGAPGTAPTISATDWHEYVDVGEFTPWIGVSQSVGLWAYAAVATTVNVVQGAY